MNERTLSCDVASECIKNDNPLVLNMQITSLTLCNDVHKNVAFSNDKIMMFGCKMANKM